MNEIPTSAKFAAPQVVTTGPIQGSRKVYASPEGRPDLRIPFREIALSDPSETPVRVYDPSGPYTEAEPADRPEPGPETGARGLDRRTRLPDRRGPGDQAGGQRQRRRRPARAALSGDPHAARRRRRPARHPVRIRPRRDRHGRDDLRRPPGESRARGGGRGRRPSGSPTARALGPRSPNSSRRNSCAARLRAAAPSSRPTSITSNSSRWRSAAISWSRSTPTSAIRR